METTRRVSDLSPQDVPIVERLFGQRLDNMVDAVLILRVPETVSPIDGDELPAWCNVLEGMSDEDLAEFNSLIELPVRIGSPEA